MGRGKNFEFPSFFLSSKSKQTNLVNNRLYQGSAVQVQESGPSCSYVALAGRKSAVGHFPQSEEYPVCYQLVCFITVELKLLSNSNYITLDFTTP